MFSWTSYGRVSRKFVLVLFSLRVCSCPLLCWRAGPGHVADDMVTMKEENKIEIADREPEAN